MGGRKDGMKSWRNGNRIFLFFFFQREASDRKKIKCKCLLSLEKVPPSPALLIEQMRFEAVSLKTESRSKIRGAAERHSRTPECDLANREH